MTFPPAGLSVWTSRSLRAGTAPGRPLTAQSGPSGSVRASRTWPGSSESGAATVKERRSWLAFPAASCAATESSAVPVAWVVATTR
ncbi:MAG: hypothetical protein QM765_49660 [Myxococcales bacterium]